jgi:cobalt-zinc-cadmium efflux system membrane fusion protein
MSNRTLALFPVLATSLLVACGGEAPPPVQQPLVQDDLVTLTPAQVQSAGIQSQAVTTGMQRQTVQVPGAVTSPDTSQATVGSLVEGRVERVAVLPGDRVRAGDLLVEIHSHELMDARAALATAEANLVYEEEAAQRAGRLYEAGAISLEELQRRTASLTGAAAEVNRATEMVEHLYPTAGGNASAVAPRDGTIFRTMVSTGQVVLPGTPLVRMGSSAELWVTAFLPEGTATAMEIGDEVEVEFPSLSRTRARASLIQQGQYVDPANRSVESRFRILAPPTGLRPGAFATVEVNSALAFQGVRLQEAAAVRLGGGDAVFLEEGEGRYRMQPVTVTPLEPGVVVVEGIPDGARVVVSGAYFLKSVMETAGAAEGGPEA